MEGLRPRKDRSYGGENEIINNVSVISKGSFEEVGGLGYFSPSNETFRTQLVTNDKLFLRAQAQQTMFNIATFGFWWRPGWAGQSC